MGVDFGLPHFDADLQELGQLAETAGYRVADRVSCKRRAPDPALFVGSGKADEIKMLVQSTGASEVLFDQALSPAQQRNLERHMGCPVNDRTLLILEIFAQRARSHEGKLQVELAQLRHMATRLVRGWTHLERQRGGAIGLRGPGETQLETDRRLLQRRVEQLQKRLEKETLSGLDDLSHVEIPQKVALLATPFSIEDGTLTLTDKVKRRVVQERYASLIDRFYLPENEDRTVFTA